MESRRLCAYNQTRECFLGLEVSIADLALAELKGRLRRLALKSGEGFWMTPFKGIPETDMLAPLDLIYLNEECQAIEVVESYPTFRVSPSSPLPASVLALPIHSIYSSQTQTGDQLVLCLAEEMEGHLERFSNLNRNNNQGSVQSAVLLRGQPLWSGGPGVVELGNRTREDSARTEQSYEMDLIEPGMNDIKPPRKWLQRWWSPDPRKAPELRSAPRGVVPGLAAYYWTGAAPKAHSVRDISATGLYVVTEERWYPGTLILMTLQEADKEEESSGLVLSVHSKAVRWGNDGVGLQLIPLDSSAAKNEGNPLVKGANQREIEEFLERLRKDVGYMPVGRHA
jgi:uncharacterized membrane protein (UPF0127 family)